MSEQDDRLLRNPRAPQMINVSSEHGPSLVNPAHIKKVSGSGKPGQLCLVFTDGEKQFCNGYLDGYIYALRQLAVNPSTPIVDLKPDFRYAVKEQDEDPIPDDEATKV